ncbi:MAG: AMP-binding protein [Arenicellales bacterium]
MAENTIELIKTQANLRPSAPALVGTDGCVLNYREVHDSVMRVAGVLSKRGFKVKDRVILAVENGPRQVVALLGISHVAAAVLVDPWLKKTELERVFDATRPALFIADSSLGEDLIDVTNKKGVELMALNKDGKTSASPSEDLWRIETIGYEASLSSDEDVAALVATSGSTAASKFVPVTHRMERARLKNLVSALSLTADDVYLNFMPQFHSTGKGLILVTLISGGCVICASPFDLGNFHDLVEQYEPSWTSLSATMCRMLLKLPKQSSRSSLRFIRISNEAVTKELVSKVRNEFDVPVAVSYGTSETGLISCTPISIEVWKSGAVGVPKNCEVSIVDESGTSLPPGEVGEIIVKGPNVMSGYFEIGFNKNDVAESFDTGDLGFLDEDSWLHVTSRIKEVINRGGEKIAPGEIEECLLMHEAVEEACCFSMASETYGEEPGAAVVVKDQCELTAAQIKQHVREHLSYSKVPSKVFLLESIPETSAGKVSRTRVSEICMSNLGSK